MTTTFRCSPPSCYRPSICGESFRSWRYRCYSAGPSSVPRRCCHCCSLCCCCCYWATSFQMRTSQTWLQHTLAHVGFFANRHPNRSGFVLFSFNSPHTKTSKITNQNSLRTCSSSKFGPILFPFSPYSFTRGNRFLATFLCDSAPCVVVSPTR